MTTKALGDLDDIQPVVLPFGKKTAPQPVKSPEPAKAPVAATKATVTAPDPKPMVELPPSTYEEGGWRPWADERDAAGYDFFEWVENCNLIETGHEPKEPRNPRHKGLFPPNPNRRQPVAESPEAPKKTPATAPDGERLTVHRLDAYAHRPSRKTRAAKSQDSGARYIRRTDVRVMEELVSWGYLDREQLAALLGVTPNGVVRRTNKLVAMGLLEPANGYNGRTVYCVTEAGRRLIQADKFPTPSLSLSRHDHRDAQAAVGAWLQRRFPKAVVVTERELQRAGYDPDGKVGPGGDFGPRLRRLAPWLAAQARNDFSVWTPAIRDHAGQVKARHRPDLMLVQEGKLPVVIEVELTEKSRKSDIRESVRAFAAAQAAGHLGKVVYLVSEESTLSAKRLRKLLDKAIADERVTVNIVVESIPPEVWRPTAARLRDPQ